MTENEQAIAELWKQIHELQTECRGDLRQVVMDTLNVDNITAEFPGVEVEVNDHQISFKRKREGDLHPSEIFYIYFHRNYFRESDEESYQKLRIGYYSTSSDEVWETERLIMLGRLAYQFLYRKDLLLERLNNVQKVSYPAISVLLERKYLLEQEQVQEKARLAKQKQNALMVRLQTEGLTYDKVTVDFLKRFDGYRNVVRAKVLPTMGKTYNVELTVQYWDNSLHTVLIERVKADNLPRLIHYSLEWKAE